ncbi:MAG: UPF0149 family protein [Rhodanobacteraceae bacterium]|nr:UPF0149 family protein [Rhodanobacteraceae bacterium]
MENAPDFDELVAALRSLNAGIGASDLHGSLCGYLCAGGQNIRQFLEAVSLQTLLDSEADAHHRAAIAGLVQHSHRELESDEYTFAPLLPDPERPVAERTEALQQWCQGFVGGLGLGGFADERKLSEDGREVLRDLLEIARTAVSHDEDSEVDETALAELTEFARVAALLLRSDLRAPAAATAGMAGSA